MPAAVAEDLVRVRRFSKPVRVRVDLHGVSTFASGDNSESRRTLIRWEWIDTITPGPTGVVVLSADSSLTLPDHSFGLTPDALSRQLESARSIVTRSDVIAELVASRG